MEQGNRYLTRTDKESGEAGLVGLSTVGLAVFIAAGIAAYRVGGVAWLVAYLLMTTAMPVTLLVAWKRHERRESTHSRRKRSHT